MELLPLPIVITKEGKWFVASCPMLDIATQGKTEEEVRENIEDLIKEYMEDPDTPKPKLKAMMSTRIVMTFVPVEMKKYAKTSSYSTA